MRKLRACLSIVLAASVVGCAGGWSTVSQPAPRLLANGMPRHLRLHLQGDTTVELLHAVLVDDTTVVDARPAAGEPSRAIPLARVVGIDAWQSSAERTVGAGALGMVALVLAVIAIVAEGID